MLVQYEEGDAGNSFVGMQREHQDGCRCLCSGRGKRDREKNSSEREGLPVRIQGQRKELEVRQEGLPIQRRFFSRTMPMCPRTP